MVSYFSNIYFLLWMDIRPVGKGMKSGLEADNVKRHSEETRKTREGTEVNNEKRMTKLVE